MTANQNVLVVGSVALDGIETPFGRRNSSLGGSAVYFSWACSLFAPVSVVGVVGEDFPKSYISDMDKRGIDTASLEIAQGRTFRWEGKYEYDLNVAHTLKTELNVFQDFKPKLTQIQKNAEYLFLANIDPELQLEVVNEMNSPRIIALDTMNFWIENKRKELLQTLKKVDYLLVNDAEARQLGESPNLIKACNKIFRMGPKIIVVKQGEYGVTVFFSEDNRKKIEVFTAPSVPLESVMDPTGAGDSFAGAFMGYIASRGSIENSVLRQAVILGSVVASFTVEGFSIDMLKKTSREDIDKRFKYLKKISHFESIKDGLI